MKRPTKILAFALAMALSGTVGVTVANAGGDNQGGPSTAPVPTANDQAPDTKTLGGGTQGTSFVPISPCRIVDTRLAGGALDPDAGSRVFDVAGGGATFAAQGGKAGGCAIPAWASAIEATVTAVTSESGFLRMWPANQSAPNATFLNYGGSVNLSNTGAVGINGCTGICLVNTDLRVRAFGNPTHVVIDVNGYYIPDMAAIVNGNGTIVDSNRAASASRIQTGYYEVIFDRDITDCVYTASASNNSGQYYATVDPRISNNNGVFVRTNDAAGNTVDSKFFVSVVC